MSWTVYSYRNLDARNDSDADYRILGKWISDRLQDLGWAKQADGGQIDWSSATRPGAPTANTIGGYEIRKSTLASADIFVKIGYGCGYAATTLGIWLQTGDGGDGSLGLTGDLTTQAEEGTCCGNTSPYESTFIVAGDAYNFLVAGTDPTASNGFVCGVQRTCDANGADTSTGYYLWGAGLAAAAFSKSQYVSFATGAAAQDSAAAWSSLYIPRTVLGSGSIQYLPLYVQNGLTWSPLRDVMGAYYGSLLSEFEVPHYGATRRYKQMWAGTSASVWGFSATISQGLAVRVS